MVGPGIVLQKLRSIQQYMEGKFLDEELPNGRAGGREGSDLQKWAHLTQRSPDLLLSPCVIGE